MGKPVTVARADRRVVRELADWLVQAFNQYHTDHAAIAAVDVLLAAQKFHVHLLRVVADVSDLGDRQRSLFFQMALDSLEEGLRSVEAWEEAQRRGGVPQ